MMTIFVWHLLMPLTKTESIVGVFNGNGTAVKDFANATYPDYNSEWDSEDYYDYDVDKAKEYLEQSNYDGSSPENSNTSIPE